MAVEIRTIAETEVAAYREAMMNTFGEDRDVDPDGGDRLRALVDLEQAWAAFDGDTIVGTAATLPHEVIVPGGARVAMAGLTVVTVRPTHRRRGILRELMRLHLADARARAIPISGLWASEASIYGRFGYGIAAEADVVTIDKAGALALTSTRAPDELDWLDEARARAELPAIYARAVAERPGALVRSEVWWRERRFLETPFARGGASRQRYVVARRGDERVGYVVFRQRSGFHDGLPSGKVEIVELLAIDVRASSTLWRFALSMDLFPTVTWWNAPIDEPIAWMVDDPRRVARRRTDNLWVRVDDVPAALAARAYATGVDTTLRLRVEGETWEVVVVGGRARCTATTRPPELELGRAELGALYLGGVGASRLAAADRIRGDAAALARADRVFAWAVTPWCPELF